MGNFLGIYGSLAALTERHPVASEGDTAIIGGVVYYWNQYEYHWQDYPVPTDEQESGGSDSGSHQAPAHHATHKVGEYDTLLELWEDYPDGGHDGDYAVVSGNEYYWDDDLKLWIDIPVEDTGREVTKFDGDVTIGNDLYVGGRIHCMWVFSPYDRLFQRLYMRFSGIEDYVDELDDSVTALQTRLAGDENTIQQILTRMGDMSTVSCYNSISSLGGGVYLFSGSNVPDVTIAAGGGGGTPGDLSNYYTKTQIDQLLAYKVDTAFFNALFVGMGSGDTAYPANSATANITRIKALKDFFSVGGVSALGYSSGGSGGGGGDTLGALLTALNSLNMPVSASYLHYDGSSFEWVSGTPGGGGDSLAQPLSAINSAGLGSASVAGQTMVYTNTGWQLQTISNWVDTGTFATRDWVNSNFVGSQSYNTLAGRVTNLEQTCLTETTADQRYVTISFFNRLFAAENGNASVTVNDISTTITKIKALADFYSEGGISALGYSSGGSGGALLLSDLLDVNVSSPSDGQTLVYNGTTGKWVNGSAGADADLSGYLYVENGTIKLNGSNYSVNADLLDGYDSSAFLKVNTNKKLWGQPFNGEQDVAGTLTGVEYIEMTGSVNVHGFGGINYKVDGNTYSAMLTNAGDGWKQFVVGYGMGMNGYDTYLDGKDVRLRVWDNTNNTYQVPLLAGLDNNNNSYVQIDKTLRVGDGNGHYFPVTYDSTNNALCFSGDIYATGGISALGFSSTPNGGALINGTLEVAGSATLRGNATVAGTTGIDGVMTLGNRLDFHREVEGVSANSSIFTDTDGNLGIESYGHLSINSDIVMGDNCNIDVSKLTASEVETSSLKVGTNENAPGAIISRIYFDEGYLKVTIGNTTHKFQPVVS